MNKRGSGILLHITSLPSPYGIGDFGPDAYRFVDFLSASGQGFWQILPLNPTSVVLGNSPYSSYSAFAGNHILISPDILIEDGLLLMSDIKAHVSIPAGRVDYRAVAEFKEKILLRAYDNFRKKPGLKDEFEDFCRNNSFWLDDYTLFVALKEKFNGIAWSGWPDDLKHRKDKTLKSWNKTLNDRISMEKFFQYIFFRQWSALKGYCNEKNIKIIGDIPIYVIFDSSDVWANPEMFKLDREMRPMFVAGVPPDYYSKTGQLWGNPVYRWDVLKESGYSWWLKRIGQNVRLYDVVRLDHFRGFVAYWEVSAGSETAASGRWVEAPAGDFFKIVCGSFPGIPIIAEDLGIITPDVDEIKDLFGFPGMKLLMFAFGDDLPLNPYIPHNYSRNCVVYTGTHDNNTVKGWFESETSPEDRERLFKYLGREVSADIIHIELMRLAMMSVANLAIIPMQDILGLGHESRMNLPATSKRNWEWRMMKEQITPELIKQLSGMTELYGRNWEAVPLT